MANTAATAVIAADYSDFVNPQWVRLLNLLQMNVRYERCAGVELFSADGRRFLDFLSGYCVHNAGHNHPAIVAALHDELDRNGPAMLQSHVPDLAGELARRLCALAGKGMAGSGMHKAFFCSSGSEGVEAAIKFARSHTKRNGILSAAGCFHGLTCGALSLMDPGMWRDGFGPLLADTKIIPFADLDALHLELSTKRYAMFLVEPVQSEAGIRIPPADYLREAAALCRKYGTVFGLDEVQTGMFRTGPFLASQGIDADMVILAKALSGGLIPSGAVLMTDEIHRSVFGSMERSLVHTSTFSENGLAMRAGLATLDVLEQEQLGARGEARGEYLRERLRRAIGMSPMVKEIRGVGLLNGIEFRPPRDLLARASFEAFKRIHPAMFGQVVVMRLFRDHGILAQICGNNYMVLKAAPPLTVSEPQLDRFIAALTDVVELMHRPGVFWSEALSLAGRALRS